MSRPTTARLFLITGLVTAGIVAVAACGGDDDSNPADPGVPDGSSTPDTSQQTPDTSTPDTSTPPADAGSDAELITDGGDLLPEDDGGGDPDAGFDAGPACGPLTVGAFSKTTCSSVKTLAPSGGTLTTTTYTLESVTVAGSLFFCSNTFVAYDHRGALKVTASSASTATFEFRDEYKTSGAIKRPTIVRWDVDATATEGSLAFTPKACASSTAPAAASYVVSDAAGKKVITLYLPYGKSGNARYRFVEP